MYMEDVGSHETQQEEVCNGCLGMFESRTVLLMRFYEYVWAFFLYGSFLY